MLRNPQKSRWPAFRSQHPAQKSASFLTSSPALLSGTGFSLCGRRALRLRNSPSAIFNPSPGDRGPSVRRYASTPRSCLTEIVPPSRDARSRYGMNASALSPKKTPLRVGSARRASLTPSPRSVRISRTPSISRLFASTGDIRCTFSCPAMSWAVPIAPEL
jgi:hypothetical protein